MPSAKKYNVKVRLPTSYLETLPVFATPKPKSRAKKLSAEDKKNAGSPGSSPAPADDVPAARINTGPKELSTAGLTVNTVTQTLDKSGRPCRKWKKGPREFKTFTGFKVGLSVWKPEEDEAGVAHTEQTPVQESRAEESPSKHIAV
ncbi:hypothetical protein METBIDRAFT_43682 [Metschnikowia bicuspidata var. bicuspidata NRRL YB-4993]|uniref:DUF1711-domain-containing protein n=1 Tax=Metschnikowia bicuspidata var. bicuspidata NRRL YB-4993 TaxID=869754 RepID=A0A1A0H9N7_9ASCO|nr:hypothetical protein METBIDRAFT_43682 [Metschnikowia bicuspidata var. bicuspidata NRRL YB-4993]OBA20705.1 hypothetical protein METBIDRAFT_43682 [Metschnikowia bicuspidata var. bicuspidata NRRL YB-4993]